MSLSNTGHGFVFAPTGPTDWEMGSGVATQRFGATTLNPGGQWQKWVPKGEKQKRRVETMGCTVYHSLNAFETLANFYGYKDFPPNCSERYSGVLADIGTDGQDPHTSCEAIRNFGVIPESTLPFSEDIYDVAQFYSPKPMDEDYIKLGQSVLRKYVLGHEYVFNGGAGLTPKSERLMRALERGTVCVSVYAWRQKNGKYYKEATDWDNHWVHLVGYEEGKHWLVRDSYEPFDKKIVWDTDFRSAKLYFMKPNYDGIIPNERETLISLIKRLISALTKQLGSWINSSPK